MSDDIPKNVIEETDLVAERIFSEWDKWLEGTDDAVHVALREMQNEALELEEKINTHDISEEDTLLLKENLTVLKKKMKTRVQEILQKLKEKDVAKKPQKTSDKKSNKNSTKRKEKKTNKNRE